MGLNNNTIVYTQVSSLRYPICRKWPDRSRYRSWVSDRCIPRCHNSQYNIESFGTTSMVQYVLVNCVYFFMVLHFRAFHFSPNWLCLCTHESKRRKLCLYELLKKQQQQFLNLLSNKREHYNMFLLHNFSKMLPFVIWCDCGHRTRQKIFSIL